MPEVRIYKVGVGLRTHDLLARTSAFSTSIVRSLDAGPIRSISGFLLSILHTDTRLFVTLCVADCTRHGPTLKDGGSEAAGNVVAELEGAGDPVLLPTIEDALAML